MGKLSPHRILRCMARPDGKIAVFYKPDEKTRLKAFVLGREDLLAVLKSSKHKTNLTDPYFGGSLSLQALGLFTIEGSYTTIKKILKQLNAFEVDGKSEYKASRLS